MEKLTAMRLVGMVDALKAQEQDPAARELSFLERLGLLIDQQWSWRENQALARRLHSAKLKGACVEEIDYRASRGLDKSVIRADYLIDDLPRNLQRFEGTGILYTAPHNVTATGYARVSNWQEVAEYFAGVGS